MSPRRPKKRPWYVESARKRRLKKERDEAKENRRKRKGLRF